ncbi:matrix metalloproteinase-2-like [Daktulosphaira vitifoliae]|uniref:matrix metalloproteinase-2-like n=1 Tax=Daktulosphaira vitifoliae TaxID=58002 RepID=UPI0021A983C9|nr:matrix metalloproteinase-2-like [Daktulosphaira vitifoliae]
MIVKLFFVLLYFSLCNVQCLPIDQINQKINNIHINQETLEFMQKFGYLDQSGPKSLISTEAIMDALKLVQKFGGLKETGNLNNETLKLMKSKRCGVSDVDQSKSQMRKKRFSISSSGWNKRSLSYYISHITPKLKVEGVKEEVQRAFQKWGKYSYLRFSEISTNDADIIISFGNNNHGDQYPFDGPGNVLAHAFFPEMGLLGGDIHFDESEDWTLDVNNNENNGVNFYSVAIHEMGHSLGLGHSSEPDSIMNPYYKGPRLQEIGYDDMLGMHSLYVTRTLTNEVKTTMPPSKVPKNPHVHWSTFSDENCTDDDVVTPESITTPKPNSPTKDGISDCKGNFNALSCLRGQIFLFKDDLLWRLNEPGKVLPRYPVKMLKFFNTLSNNIENDIKIDAAYERPDSNIVMFSGTKYFVFNGNHLIENSPRLIIDYKFPRFVTKVDAAMVYGNPSLTYLFSGEYYWIYDDQTKSLLQKHRYIKEQFRGVKTPIDDILTWNGAIYFFNGNQYWDYDWVQNKTKSGYPKNASEFLFGSNCRDNFRYH